MAKRSKKRQKAQVKLQELVVVTYVEDMERAKEYEALLKSNDIPALIKERHEAPEGETKGMAVMVPEDFLDEAHVVIESQAAYDDFYDFTLDDEDDRDFEDDIFDEV
jgi:hypothetical protein